MTDLEKLKALAEGATPGPWYLEEPDGDFVDVSAHSHHALARVVWQMEDNRVCGDPSPTQEANARLIVALVNAWPDLIARLKASEAATGALGKAIEFNAYSAADPLSIRFEFENEEDRLAAANAIDAPSEQGA